jgi:curved DNA-binding protein CbpA
MFLAINSGLFRYDFIDHHAILCVPIDAEIKDIRKRYLQIARILHPDSSNIKNADDKKLANQLLANLVNPAYEKLSAERYRPEYLLILAQMGRRMAQENAVQNLTKELAQQLVTAANSNLFYQQALAEIAQNQFTNLEKALENIAIASELNLVYLSKTSGQSINKPAVTVPQNNPSNLPVSTTTVPKQASVKENSVVDQYLNRAQDLIAKNQFAAAKVELQDALRLEPKNSRCHSFIAIVYLRQNQLRMAKVHFDNALKLDPQDKLALEWKPKVDQALGIKGSDAQSSTSKNSEKQSDVSGSGGLFGGLFGGKKK